jgi:hypothetical protein
MRPSLTVARRLLYWGLPPLILYFIFRRIDLQQLGQIVSNADLPLILTGTAMQLPVVVLGALRWHYLIRHYECASFTLARSVGEYWKSVAVGILVPGSLGSDAYRVMTSGRQKGFFLRSAFVIGVEKLAALFSCAVLVATLYPLLGANHLPAMVADMIDVLYVLFLSGIAFAISVILIRRQDWAQRLAGAFSAKIGALAQRVASMSPTVVRQETTSPSDSLSLVLSMFSPAVALPVVTLSLAIFLVSATQSQVYFQALGYPISFSINLFITPLLFLLVTLPISFGGIGVREGAFILAFGAFGVPAETALAVSFCSLLSILLVDGIGACLFLLSKRRQGREDAAKAGFEKTSARRQTD